MESAASCRSKKSESAGSKVCLLGTGRVILSGVPCVEAKKRRPKCRTRSEKDLLDRENEQSRNGRRQRCVGGRRSLGENSDFSRRENMSLQGLIWLWANLLPPLHRSICRVGVTGQVSTAHSLARLLARPPAASLTGLSASPRHSGYVSHLRSTEAPAPDAQLFTPSASSSRRKRCICHHKMDRFE